MYPTRKYVLMYIVSTGSLKQQYSFLTTEEILGKLDQPFIPRKDIASIAQAHAR